MWQVVTIPFQFKNPLLKLPESTEKLPGFQLLTQDLVTDLLQFVLQMGDDRFNLDNPIANFRRIRHGGTFDSSGCEMGLWLFGCYAGDTVNDRCHLRLAHRGRTGTCARFSRQSQKYRFDSLSED